MTCGTACLWATPALAHSFGTPYVLPIPLWMYVFGCVATLILTFAAAGIMAGMPQGRAPARVRLVRLAGLPQVASRWGLALLRIGAAGCLFLTILAGFIGSQNPAQNIAMTLFWVVFLLGFAYLTVLVGDLYALINPWMSAVQVAECLGINLSVSRVSYPMGWQYWPAFVLYGALIWLELFAGAKPAVLALALSIYSAGTFTGIALLGKAVWFGRVDVFGVFFRLVGKLAPVEYRAVRDGAFWAVRLRPPFIGALQGRAKHLSLVLFVLLMLASTTYDAIHDTALWTGLFWKNMLWLLQPLWGEDIGKAQHLLMNGYLAYRQAGLVLFPFLYLAIYLLVLFAARALTGTTVPLRTLALEFCYPLLPIAVAYNFTHYYTFLIAQLGAIPQLIGDPFGFGWNWFDVPQSATLTALRMGLVWHTQVGVLLAGHVVSVYLAHRVAARIFADQRSVLLSQLPFLALMIAYTLLGLWILSLPLGGTG